MALPEGTERAQVIVASDHDGMVDYFIVPEEMADDILHVNDVFNDGLVRDGILDFLSPIDFAEWHAESDVELTSFWETKHTM